MKNSNFVLLAHARSGSHMIVSLLNSHPQIECKAEVFNRLEEEECNLEYQKFIGSENDQSIIKGFKMPYHMQYLKRNTIWNKVKK